MKYDLYINNELCDLDSDSLIVLTYTMELLTNPTAVKNNYSHTVELPQTERNDVIFSHFYRNDYKAGNTNFAPLQQVPFAIYNELGEIAERGYIKLDEVAIDNTSYKYKVTLYGGLGSFFYAMSANANGDALKLGDLQYMSDIANETQLNFPITASYITSAWSNLENGAERYSVINFAPAYNGKPSGDFDAQTAIYLAQRSEIENDKSPLLNPVYGFGDLTIDKMTPTSLSYVVNSSGKNTPEIFATKVKLAKDFTEWETKDLRAYLQRPVLSIRKFFEAVQRRANDAGYTLNLDSGFFNDNNPYFAKSWLTLPSLQTLTKEGKQGQAQLSAVLNIDGTATTQEIAINTELPSLTGYEYGIDFENVKVYIPQISIAVDNSEISKNVTELRFDGSLLSIDEGQPHYDRACVAWFVQAYAIDANGNIMGVSDVTIVGKYADYTSEDIATFAGFEPLTVAGGSVGYKFANDNKLRKTEIGTATTTFNCVSNIELNIETAPNADTIMLKVTKAVWLGKDNAPANVLFATGVLAQQITYSGVDSSVYGTAEVTANETVRSGSIINKSDLLDIGKTPLDLLLSYAKLFGLQWLYDRNDNSVTLMQRTDFYKGGSAVDWSDRIDQSKEQTVTPYEFDKRYYDFELETVGEWADAYEEKYGKVYGAQRVNTGYTFDNENKNLLDGNSLKGCAEVLEQSKYYNNITENDQICPSVFLEGGEYTTYTDGETSTEQIQTPTNSASIEYMQEGLQGYDLIAKPQLHTADNSAIDEGLMLLLYNGSFSTIGTPYERFRLTDDVPEMAILNEGKLCWLLEGAWRNFAPRIVPMPHFVRASDGVSLDMGVPQELDNPDPDTKAVQNSIYSQYWRDYLGDRYDQNSRVLSCYVDLQGVQVRNALFRNFYYFDNAVWVLNKITNYSLTTTGTTKCEFVKVQDIKNYKGE